MRQASDIGTQVNPRSCRMVWRGEIWLNWSPWVVETGANFFLERWLNKLPTRKWWLVLLHPYLPRVSFLPLAFDPGKNDQGFRFSSTWLVSNWSFSLNPKQLLQKSSAFIFTVDRIAKVWTGKKRTIGFRVHTSLACESPILITIVPMIYLLVRTK